VCACARPIGVQKQDGGGADADRVARGLNARAVHRRVADAQPLLTTPPQSTRLTPSHIRLTQIRDPLHTCTHTGTHAHTHTHKHRIPLSRLATQQTEI